MDDTAPAGAPESPNGEKDSVSGVWTSGGGGEAGDLMNPWFVQNTTHVTVCAVVDLDTFHVQGGKVDVLPGVVTQALAFWRAEFAKAFVVAGAVQVATQEFHLAPLVTAAGGKLTGACPDDTKLTVQFGFLTSEQLAWFKANGHPLGQLIGMTVRTAYNPVALQGRGFVFLAGDDGPAAITAPSLTSRPWEKGTTRIVEVLKHELGHVFGVPHRGFSGNSVMAADYPETLLAKANADWTSDGPSDEPFFAIEAPWTARDFCGGVRYGWRRFLGAQEEDQCTRIQYEKDHIDFFTGPASDSLVLRGTLALDAKTTFQWEDAVHLYVTAEATAIQIPEPHIGAGVAPLLTGPMFKINERQGVFKSADGRLERKVEVTFNPMGLGFSQSVFRVEIDGKVYRNLDFVYGPAD